MYQIIAIQILSFHTYQKKKKKDFRKLQNDFHENHSRLTQSQLSYQSNKCKMP